jgi:transposase-like protein
MSNGTRTRDWSAEDKFKAVVESSALGEEAFGGYLREKGIHSVDLERWKKEMLEGARANGSGRPKKDPEVFELRKANQILERELNRKEKALAEVTALLVLQKKTQLIWGGKKDD